MKSGYDQFFVKAKKNANNDSTEPISLKIQQAQFKRREEKKKNKKSFPVLSMVVFGMCLVAVFVLIEKFDSIESYMSKIEIGLGAAEAQTVTTEVNKPAEEKTPVVEIKTEDNADYLFKLAERKKELDAREEELNKRSAEISKQKSEVEAKLKELEESREKISSMLKERISSDAQKIDTLVQVYSNMKPNQAAKVFESMDEDLVIEILSKMKRKNAADILNLIKTDKAQIFSERYAGYRTPAQQTTTKEESD